MQRYKSFASLLALVGVLCFAGAALAADKGSLAGMVKDADDRPAVGLSLRLEQQLPIDMGPGKGRGGAHVKIVARATTDPNGKFTMPNLEPGAYTIVAGSKQQGWIYYPITIEAGKETKLDDLKLTKVE